MQYCMVCVFVLIISVASAWSDLYDTEFKRWALSRRSYDACKTEAGTCYSTSDCCDKYVCAAFDDIGLSPTMPGLCVHEKALKPCITNVDCESGTKCRNLDGQRYCVPYADKERFRGSMNKVMPQGSQQGFSGSSCNDDSDCAPRDMDGTTKLCCQKVRRGRNGTIQKCDPITAISVCISKRK